MRIHRELTTDSENRLGDRLRGSCPSPPRNYLLSFFLSFFLDSPRSPPEARYAPFLPAHDRGDFAIVTFGAWAPFIPALHRPRMQQLREHA